MPAYPGLGLDLRYHNQVHGNSDHMYPMGIHNNCHGSESELLFIREVAMMMVMDRLSDKPNWNRKVFDESITGKWIEEGLALPVDALWHEIVEGNSYDDETLEPGQQYLDFPKKLKTILDRECLEYCIKELREKAKHFDKTGIIPTLDATGSVAKSDSIVTESLHNALVVAFTKLIDDTQENPDWHPLTNNCVRNLVHPSLYPLVYGRTRVFQEEVVGVEDAIEKWAGKGDIIPEQVNQNQSNAGESRGIGGSVINDSLWSNKYQWLPSNVKVQDDGSIKFTSYINNLHPVKYRDIYDTIEKLIETALPAWDQCLAQFESYRYLGAGRCQPRFPRNIDADDEVEENWTPRLDEFKTPPASARGSASEAEVSGDEASSDEDEPEEEIEKQDKDGSYYSGTRKEVMWKMMREPIQPAPPKFEPCNYEVKAGKRLREQFKHLQIIVKMASMELTPANPYSPAGSWHVEGQMNEHIVGTALYYLDSENVTPSHLDFRMQTSPYQDEWQDRVGQDSYSWLERVMGTGLGSRETACLQNYGSVETKPGRLLAFPNTFHHRVSPFELQDKNKPGHRRFIALWLVDPFTPVISTANVPPQQQDWWMDSCFGNLDAQEAEKIPQYMARLMLEHAPGLPALQRAAEGNRQGLPVELMEMVRDRLGEALPMSLAEAREHRLELMDERTVVQDETKDNWHSVTYISFCEH